jgi:hypothetical protein
MELFLAGRRPLISSRSSGGGRYWRKGPEEAEKTQRPVLPARWHLLARRWIPAVKLALYSSELGRGYSSIRIFLLYEKNLGVRKQWPTEIHGNFPQLQPCYYGNFPLLQPCYWGRQGTYPQRELVQSAGERSTEWSVKIHWKLHGRKQSWPNLMYFPAFAWKDWGNYEKQTFMKIHSATVEAVRISETSVNFHVTTRRCIPEDSTTKRHRDDRLPLLWRNEKLQPELLKPVNVYCGTGQNRCQPWESVPKLKQWLGHALFSCTVRFRSHKVECAGSGLGLQENQRCRGFWYYLHTTNRCSSTRGPSIIATYFISGRKS